MVQTILFDLIFDVFQQNEMDRFRWLEVFFLFSNNVRIVDSNVLECTDIQTLVSQKYTDSKLEINVENILHR